VQQWLLAEAEAASGVRRHADLSVAYFGPDCLAAAEAGDSAVAVLAAALAEQRPHVVVLDEAWEKSSSSSWGHGFSEVLSSDALRSFRGAVVVCAPEESQDFMQPCSECWTATAKDGLHQAPCLRIIEDALANSAGSDAAEAAEADALLEQALSIQSCHLAYWIDKGRYEGCNITLFAEAGKDGEQQRLVGFLCHRLIESTGEFKVEFIFVPEWLRGSGYGKRVMHWVIGKGARLPQSECRWITLSAVDERVPFYEQFGFIDMGSDESKEEEQTWMELRNISRISEAN
jgi:hypothetical protein